MTSFFHKKIILLSLAFISSSQKCDDLALRLDKKSNETKITKTLVYVAKMM